MLLTRMLSGFFGLGLLLTSSLLLNLNEVARAELPPDVGRQLLDELQYLASDALEGRGVGTAGLDQAATYIAQSFRDAGLDVTLEAGDAYQDFEVISGAELTSPNELAFVGPDGKRVELTYDEDFRTCSFGTTGKFMAPLVFCGYGIDADDKGYSDFADIDVEGKVLIILRRTPQQDNADGPFSGQGFAQFAALNAKLMSARKHKAAAVLFVNDPHTGTSEAAKLADQLQAARQSVIDTAIGLVSGRPVAPATDPHGSPHTAAVDPHASPHAAATADPHANPHAAPHSTTAPGHEPADRPSTPPVTAATPPAKVTDHHNPHATSDTPHNPHAAEGHGTAAEKTAVPDQEQLAAAVRHLQEVAQLIENHDADPLMAFGYNGYRAGASLPSFQITQEVCDRLLQPALGTTLAELEAKIDETGTPQSIELPGWSASGASSLKLVREPVKNVIGVLEGAGPLADETIVIGRTTITSAGAATVPCPRASRRSTTGPTTTPPARSLCSNSPGAWPVARNRSPAA